MGKPTLTQRDMLYQLWHEVVGSDGDGIRHDVREIKAALPNLMTREQCQETRRQKAEGARSRWLVGKDVVLLAYGLVSTAAAALAIRGMVQALAAAAKAAGGGP